MRHLIAVAVVWVLLVGSPTGAAEPVYKNIFKPETGTNKTVQAAEKTRGQLTDLVIADLNVENRGGRWVWNARAKSMGRRFQADRLQVKAFQLDGVVKLGPAGDLIQYDRVLDKNGSVQFTRQDWTKISRATHLRLEILDTRTRRKVQKTVRMPGAQNAATAAVGTGAGAASQLKPGAFAGVTQAFALESVEYKGRGDFVVRLRNTGNVVIKAGQIEVQPLYHLTNRPVLMGKPISNYGGIPVKGIRPVNGSGRDGLYWNNQAECCIFRELELLIRDKETGQSLTHTLKISFPRYEFNGISLGTSNLTFNVSNKAPYKAAYNVRLMTMKIYSKDRDGHKTKLRCTLKDAFNSRVVLDANEGDSIYFRPQRVNAEIRRQCPNLKEGYYLAEGLQAEMYTEEADPYFKLPDYGCQHGQISVSGFNNPYGEDILY